MSDGAGAPSDPTRGGNHHVVLLAVLALVSASGYLVIALLGDLRAQIWTFEIVFFVLFLLYLVACGLVVHHPNSAILSRSPRAPSGASGDSEGSPSWRNEEVCAISKSRLGRPTRRFFASRHGESPAETAAASAQNDKKRAAAPAHNDMKHLLYGAPLALKHGLSNRSGLALIILFTVVFRLTLVPSGPSLSDDVYRYVWDGRVFAHGISPYQYPPEAEELASLRDEEIHPRINRSWARSLYPPLTEIFFLAVHQVVGDGVQDMKAAMVLVDVLNVCLLMLVLVRLGLPPARALIYGWSPLAVVEIGGSGHFEALTVAFLLLTILAWLAGRTLLAGMLLGAGAVIKLFPALLLPAFFRLSRPRPAAAFAAILILGYVPFLVVSGGGMLEFFPTYLGQEEFNSSVVFGLLGLGALFLPGNLAVLRLVPALVFLVVLVMALRRRADGPKDVLSSVYLITSAYLLLAPNVHPWYLLWMLPLVAVYLQVGRRGFAPSSYLGWLLFSGLAVLSYLFYPYRRSYDWLITLVEYAPLYGLLWLDLRPRLPAFRRYRDLLTGSA